MKNKSEKILEKILIETAVDFIESTGKWTELEQSVKNYKKEKEKNEKIDR